MLRVQGGKEVNRFDKFMNPRHPLSPWCRANLKDSDSNLLTDDWLETHPPYEEMLGDALDFFGDKCIVGGQNCALDVSVMVHSVRRMGQLHA